MFELWLSRVRLNPRNPAVRRDLLDCHQLHDRVMAAFPDGLGRGARATLGVLFRPEADSKTGVVTLIVQSGRRAAWDVAVAEADAPDEPYLLRGLPPEQKRIDAALASLASGAVLRFRLRANPTKRLPAATEGRPPNRLAGKRVGLLRAEEQLAWLARRLGEGGATLIEAQVGPDILLGAPQRGRQPGRDGTGRRPLTFQAVRCDGLLRVEDAEAFRATLAAGLGSGKAYGFGLLSVAPPRPM